MSALITTLGRHPVVMLLVGALVAELFFGTLVKYPFITFVVAVLIVEIVTMIVKHFSSTVPWTLPQNVSGWELTRQILVALAIALTVAVMMYMVYYGVTFFVGKMRSHTLKAFGCDGMRYHRKSPL